MSKTPSLDDILKKLNVDNPASMAVWITDNESRNVVLKYPKGTLAYTIKVVKYSDGNRGTTLNLRFTRVCDQKAYVASYGHARFEQYWGVDATADSIRGCFEKPQNVVPSDRNCVIIVNHMPFRGHNDNVEVILNEEVDSRSEEAKTIDRLTKENAELKRTHAAEMEIVHAEVAALRDEVATWNEMRPSKKSKSDAAESSNSA